MERSELIAALATCARADPTVIAAYLFGSRARGTARPTSDVDVGVLLQADGTVGFPTPELVFASEVERRTGLNADVVRLDRAPVDLVHRVLRDQCLVFERDRSARIAFEVRARNEYFDLLPHLERYRQARTGAVP